MKGEMDREREEKLDVEERNEKGGEEKEPTCELIEGEKKEENEKTKS